MHAISSAQARSKFSNIMNKVCEDHSPIIITRQSKQSVVIMSLEDYSAIEETFYLLKSPKNAERLNKAIEDLKTNTNFKSYSL